MRRYDLILNQHFPPTCLTRLLCWQKHGIKSGQSECCQSKPYCKHRLTSEMSINQFKSISTDLNQFLSIPINLNQVWPKWLSPKPKPYPKHCLTYEIPFSWQLSSRKLTKLISLFFLKIHLSTFEESSRFKPYAICQNQFFAYWHFSRHHCWRIYNLKRLLYWKHMLDVTCIMPPPPSRCGLESNFRKNHFCCSMNG